MGRRDLSKERREQILDAFKRCIVQVGLANTTVTKVAKEAKMKRSMIHHYVGDRNDLLAALLERHIEQDRQAFSAYLAAQGDEPDIDLLLRHFFSDWSHINPHEHMIVNALLAETAHNPRLSALCFSGFKLLEDGVATTLKTRYPNAPHEQCQTIAYAIVSMANGSSTMIGIGFDPTRLPAVQAVVKQLIHTLAAH